VTATRMRAAAVRPVPSRWLPVLLLVLAALLSGCTGGAADDGPAALADRLRSAKQTLDRAASIGLTLRADRLPAGVDGIREATGTATHDPAFRGRITIAAGGILDGQTVGVVAVGGRVFAQTPFSSSYIRVDPADFNAPDPARLMDAESGLSTLLTAATGLSPAGEERAGEEVLTAVKGQVPAATVSRIFPSASARSRFTATFWLDGGDRLRRAEVTGPFYGNAPPITYDIEVHASDKPVKIVAP
jgi:lipoprotein LprG